jgi:hypothetical protein
MSNLILPPGARATKPQTLADLIPAPKPNRLGVGVDTEHRVILTIPGFGHIPVTAEQARQYGRQLIAVAKKADELREQAHKDVTGSADAPQPKA